MQSFNSKPVIKAYLPLKLFHILPIYGLSPYEIKLSVQNVSRDREKIGHCSLLNACVKSLGFSGGFAGYQQEYEDKLLPFMKKHDLTKLCNLVQPRFLGHGAGVNLFKLTHQDISERLFFSNQPTPQKLFTGYDFPMDECWENGLWILNNHIDLNKYGLVKTSSPDFQQNINLAFQQPEMLIDIYGHDCSHKTRKLIDVIIGSQFLFRLGMGSLNLMTDQLFYPRVYTDYELQLYCLQNGNKESYIQKCKEHKEILDLFIYRIDSQEKGWVEILPYNENLIFLKGKDGEYDFIFKNQRECEFKHQIYHPYLQRDEIPKFDDTYHFKRWYYFEFMGFRQEISHKATQKFYAENPAENSFKEDIVRKYLESQYKKPQKPILQELAGFQKIKLQNGKTLMVSDLVTIQDFEIFKAENRDYFERRKQLEKNWKIDVLESVNSETDKSLPVTVTGYDVWKYIHWFNQKYHIETRLLDEEEYKEISPFPDVEWKRDKTDDKERLFFDVDDTRQIAFRDFNGNLSWAIPYMIENDFQNFKCIFVNPIFEYKNGLRFMKSNRFAELLVNKFCIRSYCFTGFSSIGIFDSKPPFESTGKYKYIKIGFRLCYELGESNAKN